MPPKPAEDKTVDEFIEDLRVMKEKAENPSIEFACTQYMGWDADRFKKEFDEPIATPVRNMHSMMVQAWAEASRPTPQKTLEEPATEDLAFRRSL